jgi:hypothetical protein
LHPVHRPSKENRGQIFEIFVIDNLSICSWIP